MFLLTLAVATEPPVTLLAVGDVLPHRRVKASAKAGWASVLGPVTAPILAADLAFGNLESPIAPDHHLGIHGEVFNAPASLAPGLAAAGFDVMSMANNHVWDQGVAGMLETRERVMAAGMKPVGVGPTCASAAEPVVTEVRGQRIGWLAMVDLLNQDLRGDPSAPCVYVPGPRCTGDCGPDRDALFFTTDREALIAHVRAVRADVDVLVVSAHWGDEYRRVPLPVYREIASDLVRAGADVVLGHHPHVLQPIEYVEAGGRRGLVAFSLGNFVSDMGRTFSPAIHPVRRGDTRDSVMLSIQVRPGPTGPTLDAVAHPVWTDNQDMIRVVPLVKGSSSLHDARLARIRDVIGPQIPFSDVRAPVR